MDQDILKNEGVHLVLTINLKHALLYWIKAFTEKQVGL